MTTIAAVVIHGHGNPNDVPFILPILVTLLVAFLVVAWFAQPPKWPTNKEMEERRKKKR